jgi:hypothetical protein
VTPIESIYFRSRLVHGDLTSAIANLPQYFGPEGGWVPHLKAALVALGNLADIEGSLRRLYRADRELAESVAAIDADLQFAKYLRNVFGGHVNEAVVAKAYEWRPELRMLPHDVEWSGTVLLNVYVLETAINTYAHENGGHRVFSSETDLIYPPDMQRFSGWLHGLVRAAGSICDRLGGITHRQVAPLGDRDEMADAFRNAGRTEFARIRKGR